MNTRWQLAFVFIAALSVAHAASAQGRGDGKPGDQGKAKGARIEAGGKKDSNRHPARPTVIVDRDGHRRIFDDYYRQRSLPPGLAKKRSLPPGLAKQLRERGELPPGLQQHLIAVPASLQLRMQPLPPNYQRYFAGPDLIVVDSPANQIIAIIRDVLR